MFGILKPRYKQFLDRLGAQLGAPIPRPYPPDLKPWLEEINDKLPYLWDAVVRLEKMNHCNKSSADVHGPVLVTCLGGGDKTPPPPPPMIPPK